MTIDTEEFRIFIGILALIVIIYRVLFIMIPMMKEGIHKKNLGIIMKSFSIIV